MPFKVRKQKGEALEILEELNLESIRKVAKDEKGGTLELFITATTHKPEFPQHTITSDKGTLQRIVSRYLQTHLGNMVSVDPFLARSYAVVLFRLDTLPDRNYSAVSIDIEDWYYLVTHPGLLRAVKR